MMIRSALALSLVLAMARHAAAACDADFHDLGPFIEAGHTVSDLVFADIGGDGDLDLVTVSSSQSSFGINVHVNDGGQYLVPFAVDGRRPSRVALADMNGDGRLDILVTEREENLEDCRLFGSCAKLRQLLADENGGFTSAGEPRVIPFIESVRRMVAADFNQDGEMDVLVAGPPINPGEPALHLIWGSDPDSGAIAGGTIQTFTTNGPIGDVVLGDFDGDTFLDFAAAVGKSDATAASHVDLYRNDAGAFAVTASRDIVSHSAGLRLVTGHFNADGHLDVAASMESSTLSSGQPHNMSGAHILLGNGTGGLNNGGALALGTQKYFDLAASDVDEDNDVDLALAGSSLRFLFNSGNGSLSTKPFGWPMSSRVFGADFNRDGRDDLAYLDPTFTHVRILSNLCPARYAELALTSSPSPSTFGGSMTFTASFTIKPNAPMPSGTIALFEGSTALGSGTINPAGNAIITVNNIAIGAHTVKARFGGGGEYGIVESNNLIHTVNRPPFGAPLNIVATGNAAANAITIRWTSTADVSTHFIMRRNDLGQWHQVGSTSMEQFTDPTVDPTRAYVYTVRSVHATDGTISPDGNLDVATTMNPVRPADRLVRAVDTTDIRSLAQSLRRAAGLAPFPFTDATLTGLQIKAVHLTELRTAIAQARTALGLPAIALTQTTITPRVTRVKFNDLQELRTSFQ